MKLYTLRTSRSSQRKDKLISIILSYRLHRRASYGLMWHWCQKPEDVEIVSVAYDEKGIPIASGMIMNYIGLFDESNIGVYVRKKHRKNGIGSAIRDRIIRLTKETVYVENDCDTSEFYRDSGVFVWKDSQNKFCPY